MLRQFALEREIAQRVEKAQAMMHRSGLGALFIPAGGGPGLMGQAKYFTNLVLWAGRAYVILGPDAPEPIIVMYSGYGAEWNRQECPAARVETTRDPDDFGRALEIARELCGSNRRIGVAHMKTGWLAGEWQRAQEGLRNYEFVDVTQELNELRAIKSPFEIEALFETGRILAEAFDRFVEIARPGVPLWEAGSAAEEVAKSQGCFWGRHKYSLDQRPYTIPATLSRRFDEEDIFVFELVYCGPHGYWNEMTSVFSFLPLPDDVAARLNGLEEVIDVTANAARPGVTFHEIARLSSEAYEDLGFQVVGKHTPDCHTIGLDEHDGNSSVHTPEAELELNMTLSLHPAPMLAGNQAFLLSDNYLVTAEGGVRLSPKTWHYQHVGSA